MGSSPDGLIRELRGFRRKLARRYPVERMILFGSRARGEAHRFSDVDLLVVSAKFHRRNAVDRAYPLRLEWDLDYPVDFLCYTPEEFRRLSRRGGIVREALREGKVVSE
ncbi:MAG TPA: nucleotidyltransferase domain-containing protein [Thermoplasmata archaeon]|nr:nucleotidyltransferase domain-containing protein [Thermoplasmata archaeon]